MRPNKPSHRPPRVTAPPAPAPVSVADFDWTPVLEASATCVEWTLDRAAEMAMADPDELATVERVRTWARARLAGVTLPLARADLLVVIALVMQRFERPMTTCALRGMSTRPFPRHCPGARIEVYRDPFVAFA